MIFYRINVIPDDETACGEDHDEWFTSERKARKRRMWLIKNVGDCSVTGSNLQPRQGDARRCVRQGAAT